MKRSAFNRFLEKIPELSHQQRLETRENLENDDDLKKVCDLIEKRIENNPHCPHCSGKSFVKHGIRNNLNRYKCKSCGKTFNALTGTPLAKLRKKKLWLQYADCLLESKTIRLSAAHTKISITTSFTWRHRLLTTAQLNESEKLYGIVEADETFFLKSEKGNKHLTRPPRKRGGKATKRGVSNELVSVLVAVDRNGHEADYITGFGSLSSKWLEKNFTEHIDEQAILVTDGAKAFECFCAVKNVEHVSVNIRQGLRVRGVFHIQNVNSYHHLLKNWIRRFHGVATKYLDHYLGWCSEIFKQKVDKAEMLLELAFELKPPVTIT